MAKRGPKPKKTALKVHTPGRVGAPVASAPACPFPLDGPALAEWDRFAPILRDKGLLADADAPAFAVYCIAYGISDTARAELATTVTIGTDNGSEKTNPAAAVAFKALDTMLKVLASFGCTPVDRAKLGLMDDAKPASPLQRFLDSQ
jgi:P27 family predicted phage terminase small subunit